MPLKAGRKPRPRSAIATPSAATTAQNARSDNLKQRLAQRFSGEGANLHADIADVVAPETAVLPDTAWVDEVCSLQAKLEDLGRSIRMEKFMGAEARAAAEAQRRAEEHKRKEAERQRRLREAARNAQNPKRRVALRLMQGREFGVGREERMKVPMRQIVDAGGHGKEIVEVVNVTAMQARCLGMMGGSGSGIEGLREEKRRADAQATWAKQAFPNGFQTDYVKLNKTSVSDKSMSRTKSMEAFRLANNERQVQAKERLAKAAQDLCEQQMCKSRSAWEFAESPVDHRASDRGAASPKAPLLDALLTKREAERTLRLNGGNNVASQGDRVARGRARALWHVVANVWCLCSVLCDVRRKHHAADVVQSFCTEISEQKRMRTSARRLVQRLRLLQCQVRDFLARKHAWCQSVTKIWTQVEDYHLQAHYARSLKFRSNNSADDNKELGLGTKGTGDVLSPHCSPRSPAAKRRSVVAASRSGPSEVWKALRIPPAYRKFMLGRWYIEQVRKSVHIIQQWADVAQIARTSHVDLKRFVHLCEEAADFHRGQVKAREQAAKPPKRTLTLVAAAPPLKCTSTFGEPQVLELMAQAAQELLKDMPTFGSHPANEGRKVGARRSARLSIWQASFDSAKAEQAQDERDERTAAAAVTAAVAAFAGEPSSGALDVDDVLKAFTLPRAVDPLASATSARTSPQAAVAL